MGFSSCVSAIKLRKAIGEMIPNNSQYVYGSGERVHSDCHPYSMCNEDAKICYTHTNVKFAALYNDENNEFYH